MSLRCRDLNYWNNGLYMLLRRRIRSNDPVNPVLKAGARALAENVPGNMSLVAFGMRRNGVHNI